MFLSSYHADVCSPARCSDQFGFNYSLDGVSGDRSSVCTYVSYIDRCDKLFYISIDSATESLFTLLTSFPFIGPPLAP